MLAGKKILIGMTGGIAAYKVPELVRLLVQANAKVRVVMTKGALAFVTPLTMQTISMHPVSTDTFDLTTEATIGHIELADWADLFVIAPATANVIAKLTLGIADDLLTTIALACKAKLLIAPAMNVNMWNHVTVQNNIAILVQRNVSIIGPCIGELACQWIGFGRMATPDDIFKRSSQLLLPKHDLKGLHILVTAGPTHEAIDPFRYITNRSSGKMGFALADAAVKRGALVTLISGPVSLQTPLGATRIDIQSCNELQEAVLKAAEHADVIVMAAAVSDYRPKIFSSAKLKKNSLGQTPTIDLKENPDILGGLQSMQWKKKKPFIVGFAAETEHIEEYAKKKYEEKGCDLIVANPINEEHAGFQTDTNRVYLVYKQGNAIQGSWLPLLSKQEVADHILDKISECT